MPHEIGVLTRVGGGLALAVGACLIGLVVYIWMLRGYNPYTLKGRVTVTIIGVVLVYAGCQWVRGQAAFTRRGDHEGRPREPQAPTE